MSILLIIIGITLIYFATRSHAPGTGPTVKETVKDLANKEVGSAIKTVAIGGLKFYLKIMMILFGGVFILIGLMVALFF